MGWPANAWNTRIVVVARQPPFEYVDYLVIVDVAECQRKIVSYDVYRRDIYFFTSRYVYSTLRGVSFLYGPSSDIRRPPKDMYALLQLN